METQTHPVSFDDTAIAFQSKTDGELKKAAWLFKLFKYQWLIKKGPSLATFALNIGLPVKGLIRNTIFAHFCGGETISECQHTINTLSKYHVGTILDYSVEGEEKENVFDHTCREIQLTIRKSAQEPGKIPFAVFKPTGIARFALLEKLDANQALSPEETAEFERIKSRFDAISGLAAELNVRLLVDAEESWIQDTMDHMVTEAMARYNKTQVLIYNTLQMYRHDRLAYLQKNIEDARNRGFKLGYKLVRGAYMEKERERAAEKGLPSPIQPDKTATDRDYNEAVKVCVEHADMISICAGSHNEESNHLLVRLMDQKGYAPSDTRFFFAQLLGMSDNISYNLAAAGYNVAKYVPYGPIKAVLPYLGRRAEENSSLAGQTGRELALITRELNRRKK